MSVSRIGQSVSVEDVVVLEDAVVREDVVVLEDAVVVFPFAFALALLLGLLLRSGRLDFGNDRVKRPTAADTTEACDRRF